jgi:hypothetical protein
MEGLALFSDAVLTVLLLSNLGTTRLEVVCMKEEEVSRRKIKRICKKSGQCYLLSAWSRTYPKGTDRVSALDVERWR